MPPYAVGTGASLQALLSHLSDCPSFFAPAGDFGQELFFFRHRRLVILLKQGFNVGSRRRNIGLRATSW